jgi:hypothetical protein
MFRVLAMLPVVAILATSCSGGKTGHRASAASPDTLANGLRRDVIPGLEPWLAMWRTAIPGMDADSLRFGGIAPAFRAGHIQPSSDFDSLSREESAAFEALTARSPDGRYRLIFDHYQVISEEDGEVDISGEPDSAPLLIDERRHLADTFEFCGTPCSFDWGCWVDSASFALGGSADIDSAPDSSRGVLGIYSLVDSTVTRYFTRPVSSADYANYREAWRAWVTARYRAQHAQAARNDR